MGMVLEMQMAKFPVQYAFHASSSKGADWMVSRRRNQDGCGLPPRQLRRYTILLLRPANDLNGSCRLADSFLANSLERFTIDINTMR